MLISCCAAPYVDGGDDEHVERRALRAVSRDRQPRHATMSAAMRPAAHRHVLPPPLHRHPGRHAVPLVHLTSRDVQHSEQRARQCTMVLTVTPFSTNRLPSSVSATASTTCNCERSGGGSTDTPSARNTDASPPPSRMAMEKVA